MAHAVIDYAMTDGDENRQKKTKNEQKKIAWKLRKS